MQSDNKASYSYSLNIDDFSKTLGERWNIQPNIFKDYIFANLCIAMIKNAELKKSINKLYNLNRLKFNSAVLNSSCINHLIITQGTLQQELDARKALGILLVAETDYTLRDTIVNLLRKNYTVIFNAVRKHDKRELSKRYLNMDGITRKIQGRLDASVYFYFCLYRSKEIVDQGFVNSIIEDMKDFEFYDPITRIIPKELELHKDEIQKIKALIKREYGKLNNYKDIIDNNLESIAEFGDILENIFIINKLDIHHLFANSDFINLDELILSYIIRNPGDIDLKIVLQTIISGIFIKSLINEYKFTKNLFFNNDTEAILFEKNSLNEKLEKCEEEKSKLVEHNILLEKDNESLSKLLNNMTNDLSKKHKFEISTLKNRVEELENQLLSEKKYRNELNKLREHLFEINNNYVPQAPKKTLDYYIASKNVIIIGGTKDWRRKFREKYPTLRTLNGFNGSFDPNILINYDYVYFYTSYMDHATYYRAMNFIRSHDIKFGYIGKTNMELVEYELMDELEKYNQS